jgi:hypothetical protein
MYMSAAVYRNAQTSTDDYGQSKPDDWQLVVNIMCVMWTGIGRLSRNYEREMQVDTPQLLLPLSANVIVGDKILAVTDRNGNVMLGPSRVEAVTRKRTHLQAVLKRVDP